ncbi:cell division protein ZipA [Nitrosococcus halophilus Nc 4]|uniref:Cell division protein ZipA n=1 Tax=Nitrosococcus halophilus (strain Nc4) TaxID=472759 RepID=D5C142_NITHN|nr:cell division protein ZipA [Nitrosococcus halophilus]ADE14599.1 cell division protein ZipA [Nitrosococcus halophilus Nc 4]
MNDLRLALLAIGVLILVVIYLYSRWEAKRKGIRDQQLGRRRMPTLGAYEEGLEAPAGSAEPPQEAKVSPPEPEESLTSPPLGEIQGSRGSEEEFLEDLDGLATLVEETKEHHPEKKVPEHTEVMSTKEAKKSRFALPKKWFKTKSKPESAPQSPPPPPQASGPELIIVLTVVARGKSMFRGTEIVQVLEGKGLRHGEMDIYHAYSPGGRAVFSVANIMEPGSFDLEQIDHLSTPGLALFLRLPGPAGGFAAFDAMLETAELLAEKLNGEVRDERRNVLTAQAIEQIRERILGFNRTRRSMGV